MKYKRLFASALIGIIMALSICPFLGTRVYADSTTENWQNVTTNEQLVDAFRYYCKARNITIDGSFADAVTTFTTNTFNDICNGIGIDITALQANIKYRTDGNIGIQYMFDSVGITAYNRIFAEFLQNNNLEVGDENINDLVFSSKYVQLWDDSHILCYVINGTSVVAQGAPYLKTKADFRQACVNMTTISGVHSYMSDISNAYSYSIMPSCDFNGTFEKNNVRYYPSLADTGRANRKYCYSPPGLS